MFYNTFFQKISVFLKVFIFTWGPLIYQPKGSRMQKTRHYSPL